MKPAPDARDDLWQVRAEIEATKMLVLQLAQTVLPRGGQWFDRIAAEFDALALEDCAETGAQARAGADAYGAMARVLRTVALHRKSGMAARKIIDRVRRGAASGQAD